MPRHAVSPEYHNTRPDHQGWIHIYAIDASSRGWLIANFDAFSEAYPARLEIIEEQLIVKYPNHIHEFATSVISRAVYQTTDLKHNGPTDIPLLGGGIKQPNYQVFDDRDPAPCDKEAEILYAFPSLIVECAPTEAEYDVIQDIVLTLLMSQKHLSGLALKIYKKSDGMIDKLVAHLFIYMGPRGVERGTNYSEHAKRKARILYGHNPNDSWVEAKTNEDYDAFRLYGDLIEDSDEGRWYWDVERVEHIIIDTENHGKDQDIIIQRGHVYRNTPAADYSSTALVFPADELWKALLESHRQDVIRKVADESVAKLYPTERFVETVPLKREREMLEELVMCDSRVEVVIEDYQDAQPLQYELELA
ncbi:uncharacterized protein EV420DRAFT_1651184 [Desarmillaria tabescens]|uniref:Uncharacterized protein n=1 Tax=Armillaria tabescens TaxID=1929756 RepID=A0AA39MMD2_ARMTA|nr:uncharacterized protein EV420DRAFT_1651184 [Desarmillaria tabescens]KAK0439039.1 hypothetical protein EV420DRAFT_1651184 [Desarmillaria tabescens]